MRNDFLRPRCTSNDLLDLLQICLAYSNSVIAANVIIAQHRIRDPALSADCQHPCVLWRRSPRLHKGTVWAMTKKHRSCLNTQNCVNCPSSGRSLHPWPRSEIFMSFPVHQAAQNEQKIHLASANWNCCRRTYSVELVQCVRVIDAFPLAKVCKFLPWLGDAT